MSFWENGKKIFNICSIFFVLNRLGKIIAEALIAVNLVDKLVKGSALPDQILDIEEIM